MRHFGAESSARGPLRSRPRRSATAAQSSLNGPARRQCAAASGLLRPDPDPSREAQPKKKKTHFFRHFSSPEKFSHQRPQSFSCAENVKLFSRNLQEEKKFFSFLPTRFGDVTEDYITGASLRLACNIIPYAA